MTLLTNRGNVRDDLQIDPKKKIWGDDILDRYINEGQRWLINQANVDWQFQETFAYLVPVLDYQEYRASSDDNPENFFSPIVRKLLSARASTGGTMSLSDFARYTNSTVTAPSVISSFADNFFLNAGFDTAATYTTIHNMDTFDGNGTWAGTNDATTVATNAVTFKEGTGSVSFLADVSNSDSNKATLTNPDLATVTLSDDLNEGGFILWVNLTSATNIKAFEIVWGVDSTNNYSAKSYTKDVQGKRYAAGWNRIFIPTLNRRTTGSPTTSIDYVQLNITYDSSETDQTILVDDIQYVNKYLEYKYARKAEDMSGDSDESTVLTQYQYVYEKYAQYKAWQKIPGKQDLANIAFSEAKQYKNTMIDELMYNLPRTYEMPPR